MQNPQQTCKLSILVQCGVVQILYQLCSQELDQTMHIQSNHKNVHVQLHARDYVICNMTVHVPDQYTTKKSKESQEALLMHYLACNTYKCGVFMSLTTGPGTCSGQLYHWATYHNDCPSHRAIAPAVPLIYVIGGIQILLYHPSYQLGYNNYMCMIPSI